MESFGLNLLKAMNRSGRSERQMAKALNVSQPAVSKWVNGHGYPKLQIFYQTCILLDASPNEMLGWECAIHKKERGGCRKVDDRL